jgi:hypothetical protein
MKKLMLAALGAATIAYASPALAQDDPPFMVGNYWEVTGVSVDDGHGLRYSRWLADTWRGYQDFAKSQGWISDYMVLTNVHNREDEPDLYLITVMSDMPDAAEQEKRRIAFNDYNKRTMDQMQEASGQRAQFRHVGSTVLLRHMKFRD